MTPKPVDACHLRPRPDHWSTPTAASVPCVTRTPAPGRLRHARRLRRRFSQLLGLEPGREPAAPCPPRTKAPGPGPPPFRATGRRLGLWKHDKRRRGAAPPAVRGAGGCWGVGKPQNRRGAAPPRALSCSRAVVLRSPRTRLMAAPKAAPRPARFGSEVFPGVVGGGGGPAVVVARLDRG